MDNIQHDLVERQQSMHRAMLPASTPMKHSMQQVKLLLKRARKSAPLWATSAPSSRRDRSHGLQAAASNSNSNSLHHTHSILNDRQISIKAVRDSNGKQITHLTISLSEPDKAKRRMQNEKHVERNEARYNYRSRTRMRGKRKTSKLPKGSQGAKRDATSYVYALWR